MRLRQRDDRGDDIHSHVKQWLKHTSEDPYETSQQYQPADSTCEPAGVVQEPSEWFASRHRHLSCPVNPGANSDSFHEQSCNKTSRDVVTSGHNKLQKRWRSLRSIDRSTNKQHVNEKASCDKTQSRNSFLKRVTNAGKALKDSLNTKLPQLKLSKTKRLSNASAPMKSMGNLTEPDEQYYNTVGSTSTECSNVSSLRALFAASHRHGSVVSLASEFPDHSRQSEQHLTDQSSLSTVGSKYSDLSHDTSTTDIRNFERSYHV